MNLKDALTRIEELERKVKELEARPAQELHYHYHQYPVPAYAPVYPQPWCGEPAWRAGVTGGVGSGTAMVDHFQ